MTSPGWNISRPRPVRPFISRILLFGGAVLLILVVMVTLANAGCGRMEQLAREHAGYMASYGVTCSAHSLNHDNFDRRAHRGARAENVACASSKEQAMRLWRASPAHAANMALPGCVGIANVGRFWVMEIGIR